MNPEISELTTIDLEKNFSFLLDPVHMDEQEQYLHQVSGLSLVLFSGTYSFLFVRESPDKELHFFPTRSQKLAGISCYKAPVKYRTI